MLSLDPQHRNAVSVEPTVPAVIARRVIAEGVGSAIDLDRELRADAVEVEDERPDRVLATEFQSAEGTAAERLP